MSKHQVARRKHPVAKWAIAVALSSMGIGALVLAILAFALRSSFEDLDH